MTIREIMGRLQWMPHEPSIEIEVTGKKVSYTAYVKVAGSWVCEPDLPSLLAAFAWIESKVAAPDMGYGVEVSQ